MTYSVKEIFYTLQGEGRNTGRPAVFCRFAGCNLWSGRESERQSAICKFCDTDFVGTDGTNGGKYLSAIELVKKIISFWPNTDNSKKFVVLTGGEPLLQVDDILIHELHANGFEIAVETNGTIQPPAGIDWLCVSPKVGSDLVTRKGNELKLVYPQINSDPNHYSNLDFSYFYLQPMDGIFLKKNIKLSISFCLNNPKWNLSFQTHKAIGIR